MGFVKKQQHPETVIEDERKRERDCPSLLEQLSAPNPTTRRWAARDLLQCRDVTAALLERLKIESEVSVREVILTTLIRLGDQAVAEGLVDCLRSEDAALRNETVAAMKQLPDEMAPIMQGLLADPDPDVRIFAINILESLRHPNVEAWLTGVIETDAHINVCATAVDLLSEVGTDAALGALARLKERFCDAPYILFAVDLASKRIQGG